MINVNKNKFLVKLVSLLCLIGIINMDYHCVAMNNNNHYNAPSNQEDTEGVSIIEPVTKQPVFVIEDAHCVPETQRNISKSLYYLAKEHNISNIFIEGCGGIQDFDYIKLYPLPGQREKILFNYLNRGIISGVEYFIAGSSTLYDDIKVEGLEDMNVYKNNKLSLGNVSSYQSIDSIKLKLKFVIGDLIKTITSVSSPNLKNFVSDNNIDDPLGSIRSIMIQEKSLKDKSILKDYPQLCDYYKNLIAVSGANVPLIEAEFVKLLSDNRLLASIDGGKNALSRRVAKFYANPSISDSLDEEILRVIHSIPCYVNIKTFLKHSIALKNIDYTVVANQANSYLKTYLTGLSKNITEKSCIESYFDFAAVSRLINLEFSYYEAVDYSYGDLLDKILSESVNLPYKLSMDIKSLINELRPLIKESSRFYELALKRDQSLERNFSERYNSLESPCVVVLGGFHIKQFIQHLDRNGIPYSLVDIKTGNISNSTRKIYFQHFMTNLGQIKNTVYNKNSLGAEPTLSLSGKIGPSGIWFNEITSKLVEGLKGNRELALQWISNLRANIKKSNHKISNLVLIASLVSMLGLGAINYQVQAQTLPQPSSTVPTVIIPTQPQPQTLPLIANQAIATAKSGVAAQPTPQQVGNHTTNLYDFITNAMQIHFNIHDYDYVVERFLKYAHYPIGAILILGVFYGSFLKFMQKKLSLNMLDPSDKNKKDKLSQNVDQDLIKSIKVLTDFSIMKPNLIKEKDIEELKEAIFNLNEKLFRVISLDVINKIFEKLYELANNKSYKTEIREEASLAYTHFQLVLKKERKKYDGQLSDERMQMKLFKTKLTPLQLLKYILLYPAIQKSAIDKIDHIFSVGKDHKTLKDANAKIKRLKTIQFFATIGFFGFILLFMPLPNSSTAIFFVLLLSLIKTFEIVLFYSLQGTTDKVSKWFEYHLGRVANFDRQLSGKASKYANALASGEIARWYVLSIGLNLIGAGIAVSFIDTVFLVPYLATFFLALFLGRIMLDPEFNKIKSSHYSALIGVITKITIPAIGLLFGGLVQSFVISNLLEVLIILGSGDFIRTLAESSIYTREVDDLLNKIIREDLVVSQKTWKSPKNIDSVDKLSIEEYDFKNIKSSIMNDAGIPVLDGLNLTLSKGDMAFINSSSGAGKSVFARLITYHINNKKGNVFLKTKKGVIEVVPNNISYPDLRSIFQYLPFDNIPSGLSIEYILNRHGKNKSDFIKFIKPLFHVFDEDDTKISIGKFTYSQQKKIMLGLLLFINNPVFAVLDEPFMGVDEENISLMVEFLDNYNTQHKTTIIVIDESVPSSMLPFFAKQYTLSAGKLFPLNKRIEYKEWLNKQIGQINDSEDGNQPVSEITSEIQEIQVHQPHNSKNDQNNTVDRIDSPQEDNAIANEEVAPAIYSEFSADSLYLSPEDMVAKNQLDGFMDGDILKEAKKAIEKAQEDNREKSIAELVSFCADVVNKIEVFAQEDISRKMIVIQNYISSNELPASTASSIIAQILSRVENDNLSQTSGFAKNYTDISFYLADTEFIVELLVKSIKGSVKLNYHYGDALNLVLQDNLTAKLKIELDKRSNSELLKIASNIKDKTVASFILKSRLPVYEISQIVGLFNQNEIDLVYLPYVLKNFNLANFRNWFFMAVDSGIPVNSTTLMLETADQMKSYYEVNELKQKINTAEKDAPEPSKKLIDIRLNYNYIDNAA